MLFFDPMVVFLVILLCCFTKLSTLSFISLCAATAVSEHVVVTRHCLASPVFFLFCFFPFPVLFPFFPSFFSFLSTFLFFFPFLPFLLPFFLLFLFPFCPLPPFFAFSPFLLLDFPFLFFLLAWFFFFSALFFLLSWFFLLAWFFLCFLAGSASLASLSRPDSKLLTWFSSSDDPATSARRPRPTARASSSLFILM